MMHARWQSKPADQIQIKWEDCDEWLIVDYHDAVSIDEESWEYQEASSEVGERRLNYGQWDDPISDYKAGDGQIDPGLAIKAFATKYRNH